MARGTRRTGAVSARTGAVSARGGVTVLALPAVQALLVKVARSGYTKAELRRLSGRWRRDVDDLLARCRRRP